MGTLSPDERRLVSKLTTATSITNLRAISRGRPSKVNLSRADFERAQLEVIDPTVHQMLSAGLAWMYRRHRGEPLYKSLIARKIVKGRHSLRTSALLSEFRVGDSIADCVVVNGRAHAYEIKTELDDSSKLNKQILDYQRAFGLVTVVTHESLADRYLDLIPAVEVGVLALSSRGTLSSLRAAVPMTAQLDVRTMFGAMRQHEFIDAELRISGNLLPCRPVELYSTYLSAAIQYAPTDYAVEFERQLRRRRALLPDTLADAPFEPVLSQCAAINPTALEAERIRAWLESEVN